MQVSKEGKQAVKITFLQKMGRMIPENSRFSHWLDRRIQSDLAKGFSKPLLFDQEERLNRRDVIPEITRRFRDYTFPETKVSLVELAGLGLLVAACSQVGKNSNPVEAPTPIPDYSITELYKNGDIPFGARFQIQAAPNTKVTLQKQTDANGAIVPYHFGYSTLNGGFRSETGDYLQFTQTPTSSSTEKPIALDFFVTDANLIQQFLQLTNNANQNQNLAGILKHLVFETVLLSNYRPIDPGIDIPFPSENINFVSIYDPSYPYDEGHFPPDITGIQLVQINK